MYLDPGQPVHGGASSSRSASPAPSGSPSPAPSLVVTPSLAHSTISQPIPTRPTQTNHVNNTNHIDRNQLQPGHHGPAQSLAPPPPAPHGPRLPVHRSNTPSPERGSLHSVARTSTESTQVAPMHQGSKLRQDSSEEWTDAGADDDDCKTPVRPSAKALGKRKVVEPPEGERECLS